MIGISCVLQEQRENLWVGAEEGTDALLRRLVYCVQLHANIQTYNELVFVVKSHTMLTWPTVSHCGSTRASTQISLAKQIHMIL